VKSESERYERNCDKYMKVYRRFIT